MAVFYNLFPVLYDTAIKKIMYGEAATLNPYTNTPEGIEGKPPHLSNTIKVSIDFMVKIWLVLQYG